jgi:hypothetical protein
METLARHNKVPQTWHDFKFHFRDAYIPSYYVDHLLNKLEKLKQGSKIVKYTYMILKFVSCLVD